MGLGHAMYYRKKEKAPDDEWVSSTDPDSYDAQLTADLSDDSNPEYKQDAIASVRRNLPELNHLDDKGLAEYAQSVKGRRAPVAPLPMPPKQSAADMAGIGAGRRMAAAGKAYGSIQQKVATNEANPSEITPEVAGAIRNAKVESPPLSSLLQKQPTEDDEPSKETTRIPLLMDQREMSRKAKEQGLEQTLPGYGLGTQVTLNKPFNKGGDTKYALDEMSTYATPETKGGSVVGYFTGTSDPLGQAVAGTVARLTGVDKASKLGQRINPDSLDPRASGYGLPEVGGDIGELQQRLKSAQAKAAGTDPNEEVKRVSRGVAAGADLAGKGYGAYATLKEKLAEAARSVLPPSIGGEPASTPTMDAWAKESRQAQQTAQNAAKDSRSFADNVDALDQEEVGPEYGRLKGRMVGVGAQLVSPTAAGNLLGRTVKAAAETGAGKAIGRAVDRGTQGARRMFATPVARALGETAPTQFAASSQMARDVLESAATVSRNHGDVIEAMYRDGSLEAAMPVLERHGITKPNDVSNALQDVLEHWGEAGRRSDSHLSMDLYDALQPWHAKVDALTGRAAKLAEAEAAAAEANAKRAQQAGDMSGDVAVAPPSTANRYNPLHPYYGQNPELANSLESMDARGREIAGGKAWEATTVPPDRARDLPGVRSLPAPPEGFGAMDEVKSMRPVSEIAGQLEERAKNSGASWLQRETPAEIEGRMAELKSMTAPEGFGKTARAIEEHNGGQYKAAAAELVDALPKLMEAEPDKYMRLSDLERVIAEGGQDVNRYASRKATGAVRQGGETRVSSADIEHHMQKNDLVYVRTKTATKDVPRPPEGVYANRTVTLPDGMGFEKYDGMVVDKSFAMAMEDLTKPNASLEKAKLFEQALNKALGIPQVKRSMTYGLPGFDMRVNSGDFLRHIQSEGMDGMRPEYRDIVQRISNARPGSLAEREMVELGGQNYTIGQLRDIMQKYASTQRTFAREVGRDAAKSPGMGRVIGNIPVVGPTLDKLGTAAADTMAAPGLASSSASDQMWRHMFKVGGGELNKGYSAGEGIRMLNVVTQMGRGVDAKVAAANARRLMVDFGNKNAAQHATAPFSFFNKFWSQGLQGALSVAKQNPRGFSRMYDLSRTMEAADQAMEGGAMDPRTKEWQDTLGGRARVSEGGRPVAVGLEGPAKDVTDIAAAAYHTGQWMAGDKPNGPGLGGQLLSPTLTRPAEFLSGHSLAEGRSTVPGVDSMEDLRVGGFMPQRLYQLVQDGVIKPQDAMYFLAKTTPGMPNISGPADVALRMGLSSKTPGEDVGTINRNLTSWSGLGRTRNTDPMGTGVRSLTDAEKKLALSIDMANARRYGAGKKAITPLQRSIMKAAGGQQ